MKMKPSPFDQAMKEIGEILFGNFDIREGYRKSLLILLGNLTIASKLPKTSRDWLSIEMAIHRITKQVQGSDLLEPVWQRARPIFMLTLMQD